MVKKCWYLKVIFHALDIWKINGWLLYRYHRDHQAVPKGQNTLLAFISQLVGHSDLQENEIKNRWEDLEINLCLQLEAVAKKLFSLNHSLM